MNRVGILVALIAPLAACGGSSSDDGTVTPPSSGIFTLDLPSGSELAALSADAQAVVNDFRTLNETATLSAPVTSGTATYSGATAVEIGDVATDGAYATGDINLNVDFAASTLDGTVGNLTLSPTGGTPVAVADTIFIQGGVITGSQYSASMQGTLNIGPERFGVTGSVDGAFTGSEAAETLGTVDGILINPDNSTDAILGIFVADRD